MPKLKKIQSTADVTGKTIKVGNRVAFQFYNDSKMYTGEVFLISAGVINPQVYIRYALTWTDWKGVVRNDIRTVRRPAKNVAKI